jgi:hypothetical protein
VVCSPATLMFMAGSPLAVCTSDRYCVAARCSLQRQPRQHHQQEQRTPLRQPASSSRSQQFSQPRPHQKHLQRTSAAASQTRLRRLARHQLKPSKTAAAAAAATRSPARGRRGRASTNDVFACHIHTLGTQVVNELHQTNATLILYERRHLPCKAGGSHINRLSRQSVSQL